MDNLKIPPHSAEAEQAVIGAVLLNPACWDDVSYLTDDDFYHHANRELWRRMKSSDDMRDPVSLMAGANAEQIVYISDLARNTPGSSNASMYARLVRDRSMLRKLIRECGEAISAAFSEPDSPTTVISDHIRRASAISDSAITGGGLRHVSEIAQDWIASTAERVRTGKVEGLLTGFPHIDARWGGLRDGCVYIIAGRPKTGKTTLALNIAEYVSRESPVAMFQLEMSEGELSDRLVASAGRIGLDSIRSGALDGELMHDAVAAITAINASKLYIDANPRQTIDNIRLSAKSFVREHGKSLLMIDYLGLVEMPKAGTKNEAVSEVSRQVKLLAKELRCPIILLCQMNRNAEREKRKPQLSDLRDSGSIEQDADVVAFTHKDDTEQGYSEIITRAIRSGQPGTDYLTCQFNVGRFASVPDGWFPEATEKKKYGKSRSSDEWG